METYNIYEGLDPYDPVDHQTHLSVLRCASRIVCLPIGRRWGKTFTIHLKFLDTFLNRLDDRAHKTLTGIIPPWKGLGLPRSSARRQLEDAIEAVVISPYQKQLDHARGLIESTIARSGCTELFHPDKFLASYERPPENWFVKDGAAGVIRYFVATRPSQIVGSRAIVVWLNEAGLHPQDIWRHVKPLVWEHKSNVYAEGTPTLGTSHWFVQLSISGLPPDHERSDPKVAKPNPEVTTFLGSSLTAYSPQVREESRKDVEMYGESTTYVKTEIFGDWRIPSIKVFTYNHNHHGCYIEESRGQYLIRSKIYGEIRLDDPDMIRGAIDWYKGDKPAGFLEASIWYDNPLSEDTADERPLVVVTNEYTTPRKGYSDRGYFSKMKSAQDLRGVEGFYYDPSSIQASGSAKRAGVVLFETDRRDKNGRVGMVERQLHFDRKQDVPPAMLVSHRCKTVTEQLIQFKRKRDKDGNPTAEFSQYNDWFVDCLAYLVPHIQSAGPTGAGF